MASDAQYFPSFKHFRLSRFHFCFWLSRFRFQLLWYLDPLFYFKCFNVVCCSCVFVQNAFVVRQTLIIMWY